MSRLMSATLALESTPPDRKQPTGTSAIRRFLTARRKQLAHGRDRLALADVEGHGVSGTADQ